MGKKEDKFSHAAHIKKRTEGTSNEISFSVLDAAKNALDEGSSKEDKALTKTGGISLFTLKKKQKKKETPLAKEADPPLATLNGLQSESKSSGYTKLDFSKQIGSSTGNSRTLDEEVAFRKKKRKFAQACAITVVVLTTILLVAGATSTLYRNIQIQNNAVFQLDESIRLIEKADGVIIPFDTLVQDPFTEESREEWLALEPKIEEAIVALEEARILATTASEELSEHERIETANAIIDATLAREELLASGKQLLGDAVCSAEVAMAIEASWQNVFVADEAAREAAILIEEGGDEGLVASKDKTNEAIGILQAVSAELSEQEERYSPLNLSPHLDYISKRIEALDHAVASDDALLANNIEGAQLENNAYSEADAEAVALAKLIPTDQSTLVKEAYYEKNDQLLATYEKEREKVAAADALINDYLGS